MLEIDSEGAGTVQFTNLENFGDSAVNLSKVEVNERRFSFSASGEGAGVFVARSELLNGGKVLKGEGEFEGFPIKFKLKRR